MITEPEKAFTAGVVAGKQYIRLHRALAMLTEDDVEALCRHMITSIMETTHKARPLTVMRAKDLLPSDHFPWYGVKDGLQYDVEVTVISARREMHEIKSPSKGAFGTEKIDRVWRMVVEYTEPSGKKATLKLAEDMTMSVWRPTPEDLRAELDAIG